MVLKNLTRECLLFAYLGDSYLSVQMAAALLVAAHISGWTYPRGYNKCCHA